VLAAVRELRGRKPHPPAAITPEQRLIAELGLDSLDVAELVATLEVEVGADPFAESASITDVHTVGDLIAVYLEVLKSAAR
jgi:acyl carrier protein